ncbi:Uu.00g117650.m01.CDS01 [Anthostomella pinea]|uniref:Uu.00g117650.m01.CDS01 n=1 Tax=Anthostomella pinea TaxID=933095 RepID=A0AAI8VGS5_9PEZI|nr:Uu.00g117650.m01.CDS01 [Anthostomella pinea]
MNLNEGRPVTQPQTSSYAALDADFIKTHPRDKPEMVIPESPADSGSSETRP